MESNKRRQKKFDSLEYLKYALSNCRKNRLKDEYLERAKQAPKIKAVSPKGSIFYYSVTETTTDADSESDTEDSDSEDEGDEIIDHVSAYAEPITETFADNATETPLKFKFCLSQPDSFEDFISDFKTAQPSTDVLISGTEMTNSDNNVTINRAQESNLENLFDFDEINSCIDEMWFDEFLPNSELPNLQNGMTEIPNNQKLLEFAENLMSEMTKNETENSPNEPNVSNFTENLNGGLPDGDDLYKYAEICDSATFFSSTVDEFISEFSAMTVNQ